MSDSYQAFYDAARSKIYGGGDIGSAVERAVCEALDISYQKAILQQEITCVSHEMQRPSVLFRPRIYPDGDMWCALLGEDLECGVSGFGSTPSEACAAFDIAFWKGKTPDAARAALAQAPQFATE